MKEKSSEYVQQQLSETEKDIYLKAYYEIQEKYIEAARKFNDANQILTESTDLDETQRAEIIAESQRLRADVDAITGHMNYLKSKVDIPPEPENYDSEEEYSYEDSDSEENKGKESSDEESRPPKRPRK